MAFCVLFSALSVALAVLLTVRWFEHSNAESSHQPSSPDPPRPAGIQHNLARPLLSPPDVPRAGGIEPPKAAALHWPGEGGYDFDIVGESHYQQALARLASPHSDRGARFECCAELIPDDANPHDSKAIAVKINGLAVGYFSRQDARSFRRRLGQKGWTGRTTTCDAIIVGGGKRDNGEKLFYGVKLDIKPF